MKELRYMPKITPVISITQRRIFYPALSLHLDSKLFLMNPLTYISANTQTRCSQDPAACLELLALALGRFRRTLDLSSTSPEETLLPFQKATPQQPPASLNIKSYVCDRVPLQPSRLAPLTIAVRWDY